MPEYDHLANSRKLIKSAFPSRQPAAQEKPLQSPEKRHRIKAD
jgi:hypothetical protein